MAKPQLIPKKAAAKKHHRHSPHKPDAAINVYGIDGAVKGSLALPAVFHEEYRPDLIKRAVVSAQANRRQPYGPAPRAGMMHAVYWPGKGRGMARTPRLNHGSGKGAQAPNTRGGRRAHPPRVEEDRGKAINKKERQKARRSALYAISDPKLVAARGHRFDDKLTLPVVIEDKLDELKTTKAAIGMLKTLGLYDDVERAKSGTNIRPGVGKSRGRPYREPKSLLVVVDEPGKGAAFLNLPGVDVTTNANINTEHLAPGGLPGRLAIFTESAFKAFEAPRAKPVAPATKGGDS